jgi:predicted permease
MRPANWIYTLPLRFRSLFQRRKLRKELDDELRYHIESKTEEYVATGMNPEEARYAARRAFGNPTVLKEETQDTWGWVRLEQILRDFRNGARSLWRTPRFAVAAILVMGLGIGATTALFAAVRSVLLEPLPFKDSDRLIRLYEQSADDKFSYNQNSGGVFAEWKKQSHGFSDLAIVSDGATYNLSAPGAQLPEKVSGAECSWNLFATLGIPPVVGRVFGEADDQPSAGGTAILSWGLWKRRFRGASSVINQIIYLDSKPYTVIGVMPQWFAYPGPSVHLWTAINHEESPQEMQAVDSHDFLAIGRLKPGASEEQATSELSLIIRRIHDQQPENPFISVAAQSRPLLDDIVGEVKTPLYVLLAATGCVFLIACLNVANLLVARGAARQKEIAVRTALGGSRWRLLCEHLTESFLLAAAGGAVGVIIAVSAIRWFVTMRPDMSRVDTIHLDGWVLGFAAGLVLLCAVFAGLTSAFSIKTGRILPALQEAFAFAQCGQVRVRLRKALLSLEVGVTVVLLITAALLLKSYSRLRAADLGCITRNVLTMHFSLPETKYNQASQRVNFYEELLTRTRSLPGVLGAGLVRAVPGEGYSGDSGFAIAEHPPVPVGEMQFAIERWADPGYFGALGIPFLRGETFAGIRTPAQGRQVIITEAFARKYFPDEDPLGKHLLTIGRQSFRVVGVVGNTRFHVAAHGEAWPMMYFPLYAPIYDGAVPNRVTLAVRSNGNVTSLALPIQKIVQQLDPELAVADILTMDQIISKTTLDARFEATLLLAFAVLSLVLAATGLFGVLSYLATQRTTELGVRIALGAQRSEVLRLMITDGLRPAAVGLILGLGVSVGAARVIRGLLYGAQPLDASVFVAASVLLMVVAAASCVMPALRASRIDPMQALRNE